MGSGYAYVWEFQVPSVAQPEFERHYGADGSWVKLFRHAKGYIDTLCLHDRTRPDRYLTVDRWQSEDDYLAFLAEYSLQYDQLDDECARLTVEEHFVGSFHE